SPVFSIAPIKRLSGGSKTMSHARPPRRIGSFNERLQLMARITLRQLLDHAAEYAYGVPAFNINNMEQVLAIMAAAQETDTPVILQASRGARSYAQDIMLAKWWRRPRSCIPSSRCACIKI